MWEIDSGKEPTAEIEKPFADLARSGNPLKRLQNGSKSVGE
jgi:hypothetical protein